MKKIFEKLKTKIVHKLGGYMCDPSDRADLNVVQQFERKYVELEAGYFYNHPDLLDGDNVKEWVYKELAYKLANEMLDMGLIQFLEYPSEPIFQPSCKIKARICVEDRRLEKHDDV